MFRSALLALASAGLLSAAQAALDPAQVAWQTLFDGQTLAGWVPKCVQADEGRTFFRVVDGAILVDTLADGKHGYAWLTSAREYTDFVLRLRFQAFRESPGNTGLQFRSRYDDEARWMDGPQIDIHPPGPWRTGMIWDETRGVQRWLWPPVPKGKWVEPAMALPGAKFYYASDEPSWNDLQVTVIGTKVTALLNGVKVTDFDGAGVLDDEAHVRRKTGAQGVLALQLHVGDRLKVRYKDLAIQDLREPTAG
jgi:hypothetical protein